MTKTSVLSAVSVAAILGLSSAALAQGTGMSPGAGNAPAGNTMQRQDAPSTGAPPSAPSRMDERGSGMSGDRVSPSQAQDQRGPAGNKMGSDAKGDKAGSTVGSAPGAAVNLTTEQRTKIRQNVMTDKAPRASNINFALNVGTLVPSSVHVVEVPATIVEINPQWRGYRYFVANDEIIIVEPRTSKIVAVLSI
jgi:hypothetical protein